MSDLRFEAPAWLWMALLAVPCAWVIWRWFVSMSPARRTSAWLTRAALLIVLASLLAGASAVRHTDRVAVVAVVDVSESMLARAAAYADAEGRPIAALDAARDALRHVADERGPDDLLGIVAFDGDSLAIAAPTRGSELVDRPWPSTSPEGSDLGAAVALAGALIPANASGRLLVISDGAETRGDARRAADSLARGMGSPPPIDVVPITLRTGRDVAVERLDVPASAAGESTITTRITLSATAPARGSLSLLYDGEPVDLDPDSASRSMALVLDRGQRTILAPIELLPGRVHRFRAVWEPEPRLSEDEPSSDEFAANNDAEGFTFTPGRGSVLVIDGRSTGDREDALAGVLRDEGLEVEVVAPAGAPRDAVGWQRHDLVILQNVAADEFNDDTLRSLTAHVVRFGAGLVMIGGDKSFGAGGWKGSTLEPLLPVRLDVPERLVMQRVAVMIVLDSSGSMQRSVLGSSRSQQVIANESAARAVESLPEHDLVGVIRFSSTADLVVPLALNTDPEATADRVRAIQAGGGTNLGPALELAHRQLAEADADIKHVVVLSDGRSRNAETLPPIALAMADKGIQLTTIAVGDEADRETLASLARSGGGRFFSVVDPNSLPRIFLAAVRVVRSPLIREGRFVPALTGAASVVTEGLGELRPLRGYVLTQPRDEPAIVNAMTMPEGEPLLSHWSVGLGQVAAFTSDADVWARDWRNTPLYARFWTSLARAVARPPGQRWAQLDATIVDERLRLRLDASADDGQPLNGLVVPVSVYPPEGDPVDITLTQTAAGVYEGELDAATPGAYVIAATPRRGTTALTPVIAGAVAPRGLESRRTETDDALLRDLAARTGGQVLSLDELSARVLFDRAGTEPRIAPSPIWEALLVVAIGVYLLDVATRRVAWDRWLSRRFGGDLRKAAAEALTDRTERAAGALSALRERSSRDRETPAPTLGDRDAAELARAMRARRRQEAIDSARTRVAGSRAAPEPVSSDDSQSKTPEPDEGGLLAAKRRARARFAEPDDEEHGAQQG